MAYSGKYKPINPKKYKGDPTRIIYRSLWERKFMNFCDTKPSVTKWASEEISIPYISPVDNRLLRYFPDYLVKTDKGKKFCIEIRRLIHAVNNYSCF